MRAGAHNERSLLAIVLVAVGLLWLLVQVGFVPAPLLEVLGTWWPALLIGGGLDLVAPRLQPLRVPFTAIAGAAIVVLALVGVALQPLHDGSYRLDLPAAARSVAATLTLASAATTVGSAEPGLLLEADFEGRPQGAVASRPGSLTTVQVGPGPDSGVPFLGRGRWSLGLPRGLPLDLTLTTGSGAASVDLTGTTLASITVDASSGELTTHLPGVGTVYRGRVTGGSGRLELRIAPGASVDLDVRLRSGRSEIVVGEGTDLRLTLRTGSGQVVLDLPDTAPIRLDVRDDGSGRLQLPGFLERHSGSGDTGVWRSRTLDRGGRVIEVRIEQVGSGSITVR